MEIEKPFKCSTCNAHFTNEDHLFVHKRRHEMSLNLKPGQSQQQSALDSFVDETPTPTRFFRNCEEVGLFQDLQNVNPFDEQFTKAASTAGTPSADRVQQFDFSIALPSASVATGTGSGTSTTDSFSSSRRRYSDQDTLNTPQVFGYLLNSTNSSTTGTNSSTTTTVLNPIPSTSVDLYDKIYKADLENQDTRGQKDSEEEGHSSLSSGSLFPSRSYKTKAALKLNLSPIAPSIQSTLNIESNNSGTDSFCRKPTKESPLLPEKKVELLERNRAAASRSRERRKQWVSSLESKCENLEKLLCQTKNELLLEKADNQALRCELLKHNDCEVTKKQRLSLEDLQLQHQGIQIVLVQSQSKPNQPNILRHTTTQPSIITATDISQIIQSQPVPSVVSVEVVPAVPPMTVIPRKRGRPKRGEERRVKEILLPVSTSTSGVEMLKFPLPPVTRNNMILPD